MYLIRKNVKTKTDIRNEQNLFSFLLASILNDFLHYLLPLLFGTQYMDYNFIIFFQPSKFFIINNKLVLYTILGYYFYEYNIACTQ